MSFSAPLHFRASDRLQELDAIGTASLPVSPTVTVCCLSLVTACCADGPGWPGLRGVRDPSRPKAAWRLAELQRRAPLRAQPGRENEKKKIRHYPATAAQEDSLLSPITAAADRSQKQQLFTGIT